ncbi:MAG: beta-glycosidase [Bacteroidales bacterium]|nr:beta-glycosidase [Bacteroidales bacterium]
MKTKYRIFTNCAAAVALALSMSVLTACDDDDEDFTYWLDGEEEEVTDPITDPDIVEPTYSFETMGKTTKIDFNTRYQTCEGIGASDCWLPNKLGEYWTSTRGQMAEWLFSTEIVNNQPKGIGLSTWRFNLGAGTEELGDDSGISSDNANNRMPNFISSVNSDGSFNYDWTKCPGQRYFLEQAKNYGVENFVLFSNSPIVQLTRNGLGTNYYYPNANIKDEDYPAFADYMATVAQHFVNEGYNISHISPVNEPQYDWEGNSQEGCTWRNYQVANIARKLESALIDKGIPTQISLGEAGAWDCLYSGSDDHEKTLEHFFTPGDDAYIGDLTRVDNLSVHSYYTDGSWDGMRTVRETAANAAAQYGVKLWQTEWSLLVNGNSQYEEGTEESNYWDIAQWMAMVIHNDFVKAGVTAWHYWTAMSVERWSQMDRFMLINCVPAGGNYSNDFTAEGTVEAFRTLWVLGNYSRFVRPGYTRVDLNVIDSSYFFGDAWISPDGNELVCVYTNRNAEKGVKLNIEYGNWPSTPTKIMRYTTTASKNLEGEEWNVDYRVVLEPSSVTTVVYTLN